MHPRLPLSPVLLAAALLAGCASNPPEPVMTTQGSTLVRTARVTDVRDITVRGGTPSGIGSFAGALLGGVAGSKIGSGTGSTAASIGGALAGGVAGQRVEEAGRSRSTTEVTVQFENGDVGSYRIDAGETFRIGDTVRITTVNGVSRVERR